jgi:prophage DNA circulation protein
MCNLLFNILVDDGSININNDGTNTDGANTENGNKCELINLKEYKLGVHDKLKQYNKFIHERDNTIQNLKNVFKNQDNIVKELLDEETNKFADNEFKIIMKWWNENIKEQQNNSIKSTLIWNKFKKDVVATNHNTTQKITPNVFKEIIRSFMHHSTMTTQKNKDCAFTIHNIGWKEKYTQKQTIHETRQMEIELKI